MRVLELFSGIGGCAAALSAPDRAPPTVTAFDQSPYARVAYEANHPHRVCALNLVSVRDLPEADLWWMSPPCQPYTQKGRRRDLDDPRARSLLRVLELLAHAPPPELVLENVVGFLGSRAHALLLETLAGAGFDAATHTVCPTDLGIPNKRRRVFVVASRVGPPRSLRLDRVGADLADYLDPNPDPGLTIPTSLATRYAGALDVLDPTAPGVVAACFASAYGRSPVRSGSYLATPAGGVRRFSPAEILGLLHFPPTFRFPESLTRRQAWALAGNSLSVPVVRAVLATLPGYSARGTSIP